uniref:Uncharacterized protein n=1 Tax=Lactuca sativa TaxID=4236 RepID=A0A9R1UD41_LACSA|nr:hypothetical protein LSAT_V11C900462580 [Lactuca sativa]
MGFLNTRSSKFSHVILCSDEFFRTCVGVAAERFHMESFFPKCELFGHVLDCWSHLLNFDVDLHSNLSPRRLFATTTLTVQY